VTDREGRVAALKLTPGQEHDLPAAHDLLDAVPEDAILFADKAYDSDGFVEALAERDICPNIPNRSNRREKRGFFPSFYRLPTPSSASSTNSSISGASPRAMKSAPTTTSPCASSPPPASS
jgi:transposase